MCAIGHFIQADELSPYPFEPFLDLFDLVPGSAKGASQVFHLSPQGCPVPAQGILEMDHLDALSRQDLAQGDGVAAVPARDCDDPFDAVFKDRSIDPFDPRADVV